MVSGHQDAILHLEKHSMLPAEPLGKEMVPDQSSRDLRSG